MKRLLHRFSRSYLIALFCCVQATASAQQWATAKTHEANYFSEEINSTKSLKRVLKELEAKFDVRFGYLDQVIENKSASSEGLNATSVEEALENLLTPLRLMYRKLGDRFYLIQEKPVDKLKASAANELEPLVSRQLEEFDGGTNFRLMDDRLTNMYRVVDFSVGGRITDAGDGAPLPGVNVLVKGTTTGTTSDSDGNYSVNAPDGDAVLIFSFIGYQSQEIPIGAVSHGVFKMFLILLHR